MLLLIFLKGNKVDLGFLDLDLDLGLELFWDKWNIYLTYFHQLAFSISFVVFILLNTLFSTNQANLKLYTILSGLLF